MTTQPQPTDKPCPDCKKESPDSPSQWRPRHITKTGYLQGYCSAHLYGRQKKAHQVLPDAEIEARATIDSAFTAAGQFKCLGCLGPWDGTTEGYVNFCPDCANVVHTARSLSPATVHRIVIAMSRLQLWTDRMDRWRSNAQELEMQRGRAEEDLRRTQAEQEEDPWKAWERGEVRLGPPPKNWRPPEETEDPSLAALTEFVVPYEDGKNAPEATT